MVWCRFPEDDAILKQGPKARPALVKQTAVKGKIAAVRVVYGTSTVDRIYPHDLLVDTRSDMEAAGLDWPTKFDLRLLKNLLWTAEFFELHPLRRKIILGHLSEASRATLAGIAASLPGLPQ